MNEYYLDDFLFEGDPLLTQKIRDSSVNRGGAGMVSLLKESDLLVAKKSVHPGQQHTGL